MGKIVQVMFVAIFLKPVPRRGLGSVWRWHDLQDEEALHILLGHGGEVMLPVDADKKVHRRRTQRVLKRELSGDGQDVSLRVVTGQATSSSTPATADCATL